jgi:truncated hemoglobin YjbI
MLPTPLRRTEASTLKAISAHHAILEIGDDQRSVVGAFFGVTLDEAVVHEAVEAIMAAATVEP